MLQTIHVPTLQNTATRDGSTSAPVEKIGSGGHPLARAISCPPPNSGDISPVVNGHEPERKHLKSIIKKTMSNGNTYTETGDASRDVAATGDAAQTSDYTKQTSVSASSKSSVGSDRRGILNKNCCIVS